MTLKCSTSASSTSLLYVHYPDSVRARLSATLGHQSTVGQDEGAHPQVAISAAVYIGARQNLPRGAYSEPHPRALVVRAYAP